MRYVVRTGWKKRGGKGIVILISDDGAGIDIENLKIRLEDCSIMKRADLDKCSNDELLQKVFLGFSTKKAVCHISGMGVD